MLLHIDKVSKTYRRKSGDVCALQDVSLDLDAGEFVAVRGPSGCGKSTLLMTTGGLLGPDSGQILFNGKNPYELSPHARAEFRGRSIGFVFQQFHLVPYLDVLDNVLAPSLAVASTSNGVRDRAHDLVKHFGLMKRSHHVPAELSSGERQRTALARALLNEPQLLLADEPTGNLDGKSADTVLSHLQEFAENGGAVLLVTHDERAVPFADRVIHLCEGRIESNGS
ncbi:MAG TPA: ABC transporter ATP-binding protein [Planctomycetaceae bacterium]|nr:ABC transporter ATP-binding protein [Planctomycetaceae bacterium]